MAPKVPSKRQRRATRGDSPSKPSVRVAAKPAAAAEVEPADPATIQGKVVGVIQEPDGKLTLELRSADGRRFRVCGAFPLAMGGVGSLGLETKITIGGVE